MVNLSSFIAFHARRTPARPALKYRGEEISYAALDARVRKIAGWLAAQGIGPGDVVAVLMKNSAAFLELMFATSHLGAVFLPINFRLSRDEVGYIVGNAGAHLLIVDEELAANAAGAKVVVLDEAAQHSVMRLASSAAPAADASAPAIGPDAADVHLGHDRSSQGRDALLR
ncbi:acyl-CoA synthetase (AMP-forming)/AMP-acid ligase II [Bradyrhizobium liaoningense]